MQTSEERTVERAASILVVEDRREVLDVLQRTLVASGYRVVTASDGEAGLHMALDVQPDLIILDIGLPKQNGLEVARELRKRGVRTPVLMLTARVAVSDKVVGLEAGADDYLAKPFDYDELLARVRALPRRSAMAADAAVLKVGDLTLDPMSREVTRAGRRISLTQKEYALLEFLMRNAGRPVTREQISEHVWKTEFDPSTNIVDVYINYLRKKLDAAPDGAPGAPGGAGGEGGVSTSGGGGAGGGARVHTVRGVGYVLKEG